MVVVVLCSNPVQNSVDIYEGIYVYSGKAADLCKGVKLRVVFSVSVNVKDEEIGMNFGENALFLKCQNYDIQMETGRSCGLVRILMDVF